MIHIPFLFVVLYGNYMSLPFYVNKMLSSSVLIYGATMLFQR